MTIPPVGNPTPAPLNAASKASTIKPPAIAAKPKDSDGDTDNGAPDSKGVDVKG